MKVVTVVGARPQFIKLAPLARLCDSVLVHTGQHYDEALSGDFFAELGLPRPQHNLGVGSGTHGRQTGQMLERIESVLLHEQPDVVIVFGDTNSTLAGALAAVKLHLPVAHVEAGLRCFRKDVPEEVNRVMTDHVSTLLFAPTAQAVENLRREGITRGVHLVGDIMVDALRATMERPAPRPAPAGPYLVMTLHRADLTAERLGEVLEILEHRPEKVLFPCHPRTRELLGGRRAGSNIELLPPAGHREILELVQHARVLVTDSGGLQKEAYLLGTPCLTLRSETEWVETVATGWNRLVEPAGLAGALQSLNGRPTGRPELYGDGRTAERILDVLSTSIRTKETV